MAACPSMHCPSRRRQPVPCRSRPRLPLRRRNKMKLSRSFLLVLVATAFVLGGCSVFNTIGGWFSSGGKKSTLRGVRIPVMSAESEVKVDATIANTPVVLPPPYRNTEWPESGGYASNAMYHLDVPGRLRKIW